jgi:hypothetical protein
MENITNKVLSAIKNKKPSSKWRFKLKDYTIWTTGILVVLVGSLATAVIIYMIANNDFGVRDQIGISFLELILMSMPLYWILVTMLLVVVAYYNFRHTSTGYRYKLMTIALGTVLTSIILGSVFYCVGLGQVIDKTFSERVPIYDRFGNPRKMLWVNPEEGRLAGKVIFVGSDDFKMVDFHGDDWVVEPILINLKEFDVISIFGEKTDHNHFRAKKIMPFDAHGKLKGLRGDMWQVKEN